MMVNSGHWGVGLLHGRERMARLFLSPSRWRFLLSSSSSSSSSTTSLPLNNQAFPNLEHVQEASYGESIVENIKIGAKQAVVETHTQLSIVQAKSNRVRRRKRLKDADHGIDRSCIPTHTWVVLRSLREKGHEVYLVGGSVRDLLLKNPPKDFDVLTTAKPKQVKQVFKRAPIVGKRFPVCHVHVYQKIVEVSSFCTSEDNDMVQRDSCLSPLDGKPQNERNIARQRNSIKRDFTINGLMFEPFKNILYDYIGGLDDLRKKQVRTIVCANSSFEEDCARILRAIRIAARLRFDFARDTAIALQERARSISTLPQSRLIMEADYMLSYGGAEQSFRLLWRFGILEILFPFQAAYFTSQGFKRQDKRSNMLLQLLEKLDRLVSPDRPCHTCLWYCVLGLHLSLINKPQSHVVVSALALGIQMKNLDRAMKQAERIHTKFQKVAQCFPEIHTSQNLELNGNTLRKSIIQLQNEAIKELGRMRHPASAVKALQKHRHAPEPKVLLSKLLFQKCRNVFSQLHDAKGSKRGSIVGSTIDHRKLAKGDPNEIGIAFTNIFMNTLYSYDQSEEVY